MHLSYTDQVDEYTVPGHKSALSIFHILLPAGPTQNVKQTLKGLILDSTDPSSSTCLRAGHCYEEVLTDAN